MGLKAMFNRLLSRQAKPTEPAPSRFGPDADRALADKAKAQEFERKVEEEKGRRPVR